MNQMFADNCGVSIEYLIWNPAMAPEQPSVVLIPGMANPARDWAQTPGFIARLASAGSRRIIAVSLRGRGGSDTPETGWTPAHHRSDITSVMDAERINSAYLIGYSTGGAYGIGFALHNPERVLGLAVGDFGPAVPAYGDTWAQMILQHPELDGFNRSFPPRIARESHREDYSDQLGQLTMPLLIIQGTGDGSLLGPEQLAMFDKAPNKRLVSVPCGHEVFRNPEAQRACVELISGEG